MQLTVTASEPSVVAEGPASVLMKNVTQTADIFLEVGPPGSGVTTTSGYQWQSTSQSGQQPLGNGFSFGLDEDSVMYALVAPGGAPQLLHVLVT